MPLPLIGHVATADLVRHSRESGNPEVHFSILEAAPDSIREPAPDSIREPAPDSIRGHARNDGLKHGFVVLLGFFLPLLLGVAISPTALAG